MADSSACPPNNIHTDWEKHTSTIFLDSFQSNFALQQPVYASVVPVLKAALAEGEAKRQDDLAGARAEAERYRVSVCTMPDKQKKCHLTSSGISTHGVSRHSQ